MRTVSSMSLGIEDTKVRIGHEALAHSMTQDLKHPIRQGMVRILLSLQQWRQGWFCDSEV